MVAAALPVSCWETIDFAREEAVRRDGGVDPRPPLAALLAPVEQEALLARGQALVAEGRFPVQTGGRDYPWPLV